MNLLPAFAYPARGAPLALIAACTGLHLVSYWLGGSYAFQWYPVFGLSGSPAGVFAVLVGMLPTVVSWTLVLKLAVETLVDTARDRLGPDKAGMWSATDRQALEQGFLLLLFAAPLYLLALAFGIERALLFVLLALCWLPAVIALAAMDENLWHALDPRAAWALIARLGATYGVTVAWLVALVALVLGLQWLLWSRLPGVVGMAGSRFALFYALVAGYQLIGTALVSKHAALGLDLRPAITRPRLGNAEEDELMQAVDRMLANDEPVAAADALHALIQRRGASAPVHERYRELLGVLGDQARLAAHARDYVAVLLALGQEKQALALWQQARSLDAGFVLAEPDDISRLVARAAATGQSQVTVELALEFLTRFPKDRDGPQNGLLAARLMAGRLGREAEAATLLRDLLARYPEHPLASELAQELTLVQGLLAIGQK